MSRVKCVLTFDFSIKSPHNHLLLCTYYLYSMHQDVAPPNRYACMIMTQTIPVKVLFSMQCSLTQVCTLHSVSYSSIPRDVAISYECIGVTDQKKARARSRNLFPACVFNVLPNVFPISSSTPCKHTLESAPSGSYLFDLCIALKFTTTPMRFEHCFNNIAWNARSCSIVLLVLYVCIFV